MDGIEVVLVAVGLFAVGECLYTALYEGRESAQRNALNKVHMTADEWRRSWPAWLRGTALGFPFGTIPAGGTEIPTFLSYGVERKLSRTPSSSAPPVPSKAWPGPRRPTTPPSRPPWCRC
jgi:putative tricarboxylic transport membrane protein